MQEVLGAPAPDLKFFHMCAGWILRARRSTRCATAWQGSPVMSRWVHGQMALRSTPRSSKRARNTGCALWVAGPIPPTRWNLGRIPSPLPAIYTGAAEKPYREWLTINHYEAKASIGGSLDSGNVEDYYLTPWDLGYGPFIGFDHEFIGRAALEKMAAAGKHRKKVTLALDSDLVLNEMGTMFDKGNRAKFFEFPSAVYAMHPFDLVRHNGEVVGVSTWIGYSANEGKMLTLAILDEEFAEPGMEVDLVWGEPNGGTTKPTVEPHVQVEISAVVSPVPLCGSRAQDLRRYRLAQSCRLRLPHTRRPRLRGRRALASPHSGKSPSAHSNT